MKYDLPSLTTRETRELSGLIRLQRDETLEQRQIARLEELVRGRANGRLYYFRMARINAGLDWYYAADGAAARDYVTSFLAELCRITPAAERANGLINDVASADALTRALGSFRSKRPAQPTPFFTRFLPAWRTLNAASKAIVLSVVGLLVTYFALLVVSIVWDRAHPAQRTLPNLTNEPSYATLGGAVDCQWKGLTPKVGEPLPRSMLELDQGIVDLNFENGAKVTIEGPAEFEVRSSHAGFLRRGKLVATVPSRAVGFAVETPTATVTDLGTEFGVKVDGEGVTEARVFRGKIKVEAASPADGTVTQEQSVVLQANEAVRVENSSPGKKQTLTVRKADALNPFVRSLPTEKKPLALLVIAHFRMGEDDTGAAANRRTAERTANHQHKQDLRRYGSPTYVDEAAPGSTLAVKFTGASEEYFFQENVQAGYDDEFILEAWVKPASIERRSSLIVYNGCGYTDGYGISLMGPKWVVPCGGSSAGGWMDSEIDCELGRWTHLALVRQYGTSQLWINGQLAKDFGKERTIRTPSGAFSIGGSPESIGNHPNGFNGQIDEVRLSKFRAPFDPTMLLFKQSNQRGK